MNVRSAPDTAVRRARYALLALLALSALGLFGCKKAQEKVKGAGDTMKAFIIQNADDGERYCQVCAYGGKPTIMAVGDLNDEGFEEDLVEIQKVLEAHEADGLTAFAAYGRIDEGGFVPVKDAGGALEKLKALEEKLGLTYPVVLVPEELTDEEKESYQPFTDLYEVTQSRTVFVADAKNDILWSEVLKGDEKQYAALRESAKKAL